MYLFRERAGSAQRRLDLHQSRLPRSQNLPAPALRSQTALAPLRRPPQRQSQIRVPRPRVDQDHQMGAAAAGEAQTYKEGQEGRQPQA